MPIRYYTENHTRSHVFLCMLAAHLTWHLRTALSPLTFTDENRPIPEEPVAKVQRSAAAQHKTSTHTLDDGTTATSYQDLLAHPTARQYRAMTLIDQHIQNPKTLGAPTNRGS